MILYTHLYGAFIQVYKILIGIAALWNPKARLWIEGRKNILDRLGSALNAEKCDIIWMHCASLGEFEQGRPLLEKLKRIYPNYKVLVTFFSPSGYNAIKNTTIADFIYYLPFGKRSVASDFVTLVHPKLVLWVKYDYWYYFIDELSKRKIPLLLISATFRKDQIFFRWYGKLHRQMLNCFSHLFVQTDYSKNLLTEIGFSQHITISGDTRFDRVVEIASCFKPLKDIETFCGQHKVLVAGSTWSEDEEELDHFANSNPEIKFIIAPHEIDELHLKDIEKLFKRTIRYSEMQLQIADGRWMPAGSHIINEGAVQPTPNVLIIDNIGMLSRLYNYATITYVGGGFGQDGVHNVLEAAVYGKPVIFGPVFNKYIEAIELLEEGGAFTIESALELEDILKELLSDDQLYKSVCEAAKNYVMTKRGATEKIIQYIQENRLLTN